MEEFIIVVLCYESMTISDNIFICV